MTRAKRAAALRDLGATLRQLGQTGSLSRRRQAQFALMMGVGASAAGLGLLAGQILRAAAGL